VRRIVVSCRLRAARDGAAFLVRARALWVRAEALGATLIAWGADGLAFAWDEDSLEEALGLATFACEGATSAAGAWGCGISEGEMETAVLGGASRVSGSQHAELAWGAPLVVATALARAAAPGQALLDTDMGALARGELVALGPVVEAGDGARGVAFETARASAGRDVRGLESFARDSWVDGLLAKRVRAMTQGAREDTLTALRRARARVDSGPSALRCQASLALGVALAVAGRPEDALLEGLDALARAREDGDRRALEACLAFLAKLYATVGRGEQAAELKALARSATT
jgi:hypothetical protein